MINAPRGVFTDPPHLLGVRHRINDVPCAGRNEVHHFETFAAHGFAHDHVGLKEHVFLPRAGDRRHNAGVRRVIDRIERVQGQLLMFGERAHANEIVFTSGGTEANNLAIRGIADRAQLHGRHMIISAFEHPSVRASADLLEQRGWEVTMLPVYEEGVVRLDDFRAAFRPDTDRRRRSIQR